MVSLTARNLLLLEKSAVKFHWSDVERRSRRGNTSCVPRSRNCISCVPRWPLQVYQLRPEVAASSVSVASQGGRLKCISCVPRWPLQVYQLLSGFWTPNMTSCVPRLVRNCISCTERYGCTKCPTIGRFLQFYCTLLYIQLYTHKQNCWMLATTQFLYHVIV